MFVTNLPMLCIVIDCKVLSDDDRKNYKLNEEVGYYLISVQDNTIGFPQNYSEQISEIFQRLNNKINHGRTGIGLALCRKIVNNQGGIITEKSEEGQGVEFEIILPALFVVLFIYTTYLPPEIVVITPHWLQLLNLILQ
ncbi:MAG TPA: ATP-binding protein [Segetibacter sp.]|nr:ATP-binding protein [Segetibacter sp.]